MHLDTEDTAVHTTENHDFGFVTDADVVLLHDEVARDDRSRTDQDQYEHDTHRDLDPFAAFPTLPRSLIRVWVGRPWFYSLWGGLGQCLCACRGGVGLRRFDFGTVPGGAADDRIVVTELDVDHVGDQHRDVVGSAAFECEFDHAVGALLWSGDLHRLTQRLVGDHARQSVGADEIAVTGSRLTYRQTGLDLVAGECLEQQRTLWVCLRLILGDLALFDEFVDEAVVPGDLRERAVAQQVGA